VSSWCSRLPFQGLVTTRCLWAWALGQRLSLSSQRAPGAFWPSMFFMGCSSAGLAGFPAGVSASPAGVSASLAGVLAFSTGFPMFSVGFPAFCRPLTDVCILCGLCSSFNP
jgi:hypothetical protein